MQFDMAKFAATRKMQIESGRDLTYNTLSAEICSRIEGSGNLLEVGCGTGHLLRRIRDIGLCAKLTGIDPSEDMIKIAKHVQPEADLYCVSAQKFQFSGFDIAIANLVLHSEEDIGGLLSSVRRALTPKATFILTLPHPFAYWQEYWQTFRDASYGESRLFALPLSVSAWPSDVMPVPYFHRPLSRYINEFSVDWNILEAHEICVPGTERIRTCPAYPRYVLFKLSIK